MKAGIIAGSGFYDVSDARLRETKKIGTPFGDPSDTYRFYELQGIEFVFLARHGSPHRIPPHKINYRANIWGFRELGVERIIAVHATGGISRELKPGDIVIPDQMIDMTHGRQSTFFAEDEVFHIDFTNPFCNEIRQGLVRAGKDRGDEVRETGTYLCVNGPRLETSAEIRHFSMIGADVVGMTGMPEACLAREQELCFASVSVVTNYAAGISPSPLTTTEVIETMKVSMASVRNMIFTALGSLPSDRSCPCRNALTGSRM